MREIKFRCWDKENKKLREVKEISFDYEEVVVKRESEFIDEARVRGEKFCSCCDSGYHDEFIELKNIDLMQYIGLKDKNGKEIYDGDICKISFNVDDVEDHIWLHLTDEQKKTGTKIFIVENPLLNFQEEFTAEIIEVIGNIYDNPELLEETNPKEGG